MELKSQLPYRMDLRVNCDCQQSGRGGMAYGQANPPQSTISASNPLSMPGLTPLPPHTSWGPTSTQAANPQARSRRLLPYFLVTTYIVPSPNPITCSRFVTDINSRGVNRYVLQVNRSNHTIQTLVSGGQVFAKADVSAITSAPLLFRNRHYFQVRQEINNVDPISVDRADRCVISNILNCWAIFPRNCAITISFFQLLRCAQRCC